MVETVGKVLLAIFSLRYGMGLVWLALRVALVWPLKIVFWPFFVFGGVVPVGNPQGEGATGGAGANNLNGRIGSGEEVAKGPE